MSIIKQTIYIALAAVAMCGGIANAASRTTSQPEFTVVIDAGHGGHDTGAVDNGVREKDINLGVAKKLAALIEKKMPDAKVVMTRDDDNFISLQERANIANRNRGNLFVSIHTNSVDKSNPNRRKVAGSSVYALGLHKDANNLKVAQRENSVIELESNYEQKYSGFDPKKDESYIIFEMAQKKNLGQSLKFANEAQKHLVSDAQRADRGVKQAGFWVLWATSMPAVLVELDFICNPESARFMGSDKGQEQLASALYKAVENYAIGVKPQLEVKSGSTASGEAKVSKDKNAKKESRKSTRSKKRKNKRGDDPEPEATASVPEVISGDADIPVLNVAGSHSGTRKQCATPVKSEERSYNYATVRNRTLPVGQRRRRSASSKKLNDERQIDNGEILIKKETDYLAKIEEPVSEKNSEPEPMPEVSDTKSKNIKDKNKKGKVNKSSSKNVNNSEKGKKRIVIRSTGDVAKTENLKKRDSEVSSKTDDNVKTKVSGQSVATAEVSGQTEKPVKHKRHTSLAKRRNNNGK